MAGKRKAGSHSKGTTGISCKMLSKNQWQSVMEIEPHHRLVRIALIKKPFTEQKKGLGKYAKGNGTVGTACGFLHYFSVHGVLCLLEVKY